MLVLSRKVGERLMIGDQIAVIVASVEGSRVKLAIDCPRSVRILRAELEPRDRPEKRTEENGERIESGRRESPYYPEFA